MARTGERTGSETRRIRPVPWLLGGALFVVVGLVCVLVAVAAVREPDDISGLPPCGADLHASCLAERPAVVQRRSYSRGAWLTGDQKWLLALPDGVPGRGSQRGEVVRVPRQPGAAQLHAGQDVRLVYYHRRAAIVRLPSGLDLQTDDHPNRYAPTMGYVGVFALAMGLFSWGRGWRTGRHEGFWRRGPLREASLLAVGPLFVGGGLGFLAQLLAGSHRWPGLVGLVGGLALGSYAALRRSGRLAR